MSGLYATILSDARKTNPTARAHFDVTATAQSWPASVSVRIHRDRDTDAHTVAISYAPESTPDPSRELLSCDLQVLPTMLAGARAYVHARLLLVDALDALDSYPNSDPSPAAVARAISAHLDPEGAIF